MPNANVDRDEAAAPSDDLDAAIAAASARIDAARSASVDDDDAEDDELDVDDDEATDTGSTADDNPDDEDDNDDEEDEANTPSSRSDDSSKTRQESQQKSKGAEKPNTLVTDDDEDDAPRLSRKQRGKLIEELRQEIEDKERERQRLAESLQAQREEDERLEKEVNRALGTDEELEKALEEGLSGNTTAAEKAKIWKSNREFYKKLLTRADKEAVQKFTDYYWKDVEDLPGVSQATLKTTSLNQILRHLYEAGVNSVSSKADDEIAKLKEEVLTWKGRYRSLKPKAGSGKRSPMGTGGGGSTVEEGEFDWRKKYIDPKTGLLTDEADAIVARHGVKGLHDPKLAKGR